MLDPDLLRTFVKIAETGSFSAAAITVGRTLSAVSMQMKRLEETAGRRLLNRGSQGATLTPAGEVLLLHARAILDAHEAAFDSLMNDRVARLLSIGLPEAYLNGVLAPVIPELLRCFPDTSLRIRAEPSVVCARQLEEGTLDLALVTQEQVEDRRGELIHVERCVWAARTESTVWMQSPVPLVFPVEGAMHRRMVESLRRAGKPYVIVMTGNNDPAIHAAVLTGAAVGLLPESKLGPGLCDLSSTGGFPPAPDLQVRLRTGKRMPPAGEWLAQILVDRFSGRGAPEPIS